MTDYKLPAKLSKLIEKKSATYKLTWMQPNAKQLNDIKAMVEVGAIKPIVDLIYSFKDGIDAYEYLATGRAKGKVIISLADMS
jgi:NADPH:quinone reductase-like Zn-dependent oxidoreductase